MEVLPTLQDIRALIGRAQVVPLVLTLPRPSNFDLCDAFLRLRRGEDSFAFQREGVAVIGTEPVTVIRTRSFEQKEEGAPFLQGTTDEDVFACLQRVFKQYDIPESHRQSLPELNGVAFGFIGFDAVRTLEPHLQRTPAPKDVLQMPESVIFVCPSVVVVTDQHIKIMAMCSLDGEMNHALAVARIMELRDRLTSPTSPLEPGVRDFEGPVSQGEGISNWGSDGYKSHVTFMKERVRAGDMVQAVVSHRLRIESPSHPFNVWRHLRRVSPSRYSYFVECRHGVTIVGASPELLVSSTNGFCETHPIAGTRHRTGDPSVDAASAQDLLQDKKELAEHIMLVDLGRNDLNQVCSNVCVPSLMQVEMFSHVMHIVSKVTGSLRPGCSALDALRSVFPAGTVSGAPKLMAIEHIYTRELERRGAYAGCLGVFDLSGQDMETCITIRTLLWLGRSCYAQAGAGIVLDSQEVAEYAETVAKMRGLTTALRESEKHRQTTGLSWDTLPGPTLASGAYNGQFKVREQMVASLLTPVPTRFGFREKGSVLLVDNYDSFTWNLFQFLSKTRSVVVVRNDQVTVQECLALEPTHVVIGPGPCTPAESGICGAVIQAFAGKVPILGVCMGMEVLVTVFGGKIDVIPEKFHGKLSTLVHDGQGVFASVTQGTNVTRYHSLGAFEDDLRTNAPELLVTSVTEESGTIMGVRHRTFACEGVQFHPESISTDCGDRMFANFLSWTSGCWKDGAPPSSTLRKIFEQRRLDVDTTKALPESKWGAPRSLADAIRESALPGPVIVAEVKRASPSEGWIAEGADASVMARKYQVPGVVGVSVLTEPRFFKGDVTDLCSVRESLDPNIVVLRKDFIFCEFQLREAVAYGADTALLIVAVLTAKQLKELISASRSLGMEPLVEVANEYELSRALAAGATLIGVNARDLHSLQVSVPRACSIIELGSNHQKSNKDVVFMGLSGVKSHKEVVLYRRAGARGILVGEHLMRSKNVPQTVSELLGVSLTLVKICGVCSVEDAERVVEVAPDFLGIVLVPSSRRYVFPEKALDIVRCVRQKNSSIKVVGVFADTSKEQVESAHALLTLDVIQYSKGPVVYRPAKVQIWHAVHVGDSVDGAIVSGLDEKGDDVVLFDTASAAGGGTGTAFDWKKIAHLKGERFVLAGGLSAANVSRAIRELQPWVVDVASGVEAAEGHNPPSKDPARLNAFMRAVQESMMTPPVKEVLRVMRTEGIHALSTHSIVSTFLAIVEEKLSPAQAGAFLMGLGDASVQSLIGLKEFLLEMAPVIEWGPQGKPTVVLDIVGTGGDGLATFNVSTAAALLVGRILEQHPQVLVAKHGNRSSSGACGSADFIEALATQPLSIEGAQLAIQEGRRFVYLFAGAFHSILGRPSVRALRRELGFRTVFNLLGVLINPARPTHMVLGVARPELGPMYAAVLCKIGVTGVVVCGGNMDEVNPGGPTLTWRVAGGQIHEEVLELADFGVKGSHSLQDLQGGSPHESVAKWLALAQYPALMDWVSMTAALALLTIGHAKSLKEAMQICKKNILGE